MSAMSSGLQFRLSVIEPPATATTAGAEGLLPRSLGPSLPWHLTRGGRSYVSRTEELKRRLGVAASEQYGSFRKLDKVTRQCEFPLGGE